MGVSSCPYRILWLLVLITGSFVARSYAQQQQVVFQRDIYYDIDRNGAQLGSTMHTGMRPMLESWADTTNVIGYRRDSSVHYYEFTEKVFKERLIEVRGSDFHLTADPVFHFELGKDFRDPSPFADTNLLYVNTRGAWFTGDLGKKVSFQTAFFENQDIFPQYIYARTRSTGVVPGQGRTKDFKGRAFDHGWATGYLSYTPVDWLNLQIGHGKHFVGNGYRSVLLSDAAFNYPYLKGSLRLFNGKVQYTTIFAKLQVLQRLDAGDAAESLFYWKRATFDHLSINLGERVQLGLFEGTIWRTLDSASARPFNAMNFNPIIGLNTAMNGLDSDHKEILGIDLKVRVRKGLFLYGQLAVDDPSKQKYAYQIGMHSFDQVIKHVHLQVEYNAAMPYTYTNAPAQVNYAHYNEPLAHPYGAYFDELVMIGEYRLKKWTVTLKYNLAHYHLDGDNGSQYGGDIFGQVEDLTVQGDGPLNKELHSIDARGSYLMNQYTNMRLSFGYSYRDLSESQPFLQSGYLYVAWHTALFNKYYDF